MAWSKAAATALFGTLSLPRRTEACNFPRKDDFWSRSSAGSLPHAGAHLGTGFGPSVRKPPLPSHAPMPSASRCFVLVGTVGKGSLLLRRLVSHRTRRDPCGGAQHHMRSAPVGAAEGGGSSIHFRQLTKVLFFVAS